VTDDRFSEARNLICTHEPVWDPQAFGYIGKVMDSWESQRHNPLEADVLELKLASPAQQGIAYVIVSTKYHDGNQAEAIRIEALTEDPSGNILQKFDLVPRSKLLNHALHWYKVDPSAATLRVDRVRIYNYPDGGITRVRLFAAHSLPREELEKFNAPEARTGIRYSEAIVPVVRQGEEYEVSPLMVSKNWAAAQNRAALGSSIFEIDVASAEYGGLVTGQSNQHFGPATRLLSPARPQGMSDGFETARVRGKDSSNWVVIKFARAACIHRVVLDFSFFIANNPVAAQIEAFDGISWFTLVKKTPTKHYTGNRAQFIIPASLAARRVYSAKILIYPCGGINRANFYTHSSPQLFSLPSSL